MSHTSKLFQDHQVQIKNKSGFDLAHSNFLTQKCGQLTPVCTIPMLPNDSISLGFMSQIKLPPMATSFYGRVDYRLEAFFVPYRILWGGWENFYTQPIADPYGTAVERPHFLPNYIGAHSTAVSEIFRRGTLADYLGIKGFASHAASESPFDMVSNMLPFFAYHKIYDDWYRNANIQKPAFVRQIAFRDGDSCGSLPFYPSSVTISDVTTLERGSNGSDMDIVVDEDSLGHSSKNTPLSSIQFGNTSVGKLRLSTKLADGFSLFDLRQRNWSKDYFTTATLYPQQNGTTAGAGIRSSLDISTGGSDGSTTFTISQIRQANILQKWLERNNIAGSRYADQIRATFGVLPSDAMLDRPIFLGGSSFGVYTNSIAQTVNSDKGSSTNPYSGTAGADAGQSSGFGKDSLIDKFTATEHGIIMVIGSIVPHATYSTGTSRIFAMSQFGDIPNPMFEGLGQESILKAELAPYQSHIGLDNEVFGYVDQYAWMKYMNDEVHGLLVDGESLESFALQRSFDSASAKLDSSFIQIPLDYLDQVLAVRQGQSGFSSWANFYFDVKKTSLLSQYTIPTLGEPKNTHTETIPNTGRSL